MATDSSRSAVLTDSPLADPAVRERLREQPPSAKLVARVLAEAGPLEPREIADRSLLPKRTMRYALTSLDDVGLIATRQDATDEHKQGYVLQR